MTTRLALAVAAFAFALLAAQPAPAADAPQGWAYELANELMSPYCPGRSISDCPSPQAQTLRMWLIVQEASGRTQADVEQELVERYGDLILAAPRAEGFGLTAYLVPVAGVIAGGLLLVWFLRRHTRRASIAPAAPLAAGAASAPLDPELERLVDEELEREA